MKAGLAAHIAVRRSFASPPSSASRWRHLAAQSSKELGSVNRRGRNDGRPRGCDLRWTEGDQRLYRRWVLTDASAETVGTHITRFNALRHRVLSR
jgi:hypothetical protein